MKGIMPLQQTIIEEKLENQRGWLSKLGVKAKRLFNWWGKKTETSEYEKGEEMTERHLKFL